MQTYLENYFFLRQQWRKQKQKHLAIKKCTLFLLFQDSEEVTSLRTATPVTVDGKKSCKMYTDSFLNSL